MLKLSFIKKSKSNDNKKTFYRSKKENFKAEIFICSVLVFMYFFSLIFKNSINIYVLLNSILCASMGFSIAIISFLNRDLKSGSFYKNMGIGFLVISIATFRYLFINKECILTSRNVFMDNRFLQANYYLEYLIILLPCVVQKINKKINFLLLAAVTIPFSVLFVEIIMYLIEVIPNFIIISQILLSIILISDLIIINSNGINLKCNEKKALYGYIAFISCYQYLYINYNLYNNIGIIISLSLKLIGYYIVFLLILNFTMKKSYEVMKNELIVLQKTQKELNNILKNRNKTLVELEHIIEKSSKKYSDLIEHISDGIAIFYFNKIYYINSEAKKVLNISMDDKNVVAFKDFMETLMNENKIIEKLEFVKENLDKVLSLEKDNFKFNLCSYCAVQYEVYLFNIDTITRLVYIKDVTEANRNYELKRKYKEYLKGEELKNKFYSNISHELRTPINLIYSALQLSEINLNDDKIENLEKHNDTIKHNCLRLIRTISNFIDANKISEGYLKPNLKVYNIVSVVENISLACNPYIEKINNELIFDAQEEAFYVECDKEMIERIVLNILSNSVKFGKHGGMITVNVTAKNDMVKIQIRNNGYIVSEEEKPYIFDKFTKINKELNRSNEGSGLGLYLSKALVELNGGTIELESNDKIGTEFIIKFPRCYKEEECEEEEGFQIINQLSKKVDIEFSDIYI